MNRKHIWGRLALWGTAFLWGTSFVLLKATLDSVGVLWILALRFLGAAALLALAAGKKLLRLDRRSFIGSVLMGLSLAAAYIFQTYGLSRTTPGKNAFLTAVYCVLVPFLAWLVYKRRPKPVHVIAAVLCLCGIGFVSLDSLDNGFNNGDLLTLICGFFYALQIIIMEHYVADGQSNAVSVSAVQFGTSALICLAGALLFETFPRGLSLSAWLNIAYLSAVVTGLCFFLQAVGLQYTPSSTASVILVFESVFGVLTSLLFYGERMTLKLALGFALIFFSVLLSEAGEDWLAKRQSKSV